MKFEIKHRITSAILFEWEGASIKLAVEAAVKAKIDLSGAYLSGADLSGADLRGADLKSAELRPIKSDFFEVLTHTPREIAGLRLALAEGRVDGSVYEGECACLVGTLANVRACDYRKIEGLEPESHRPAEMFFLGIKKGDTPETNQHAAIAVGWIGRERERFEREVERLNEMEYAAVVCEADIGELATRPPERTKLDPKTVMRTIAAWSVRYRRVQWHCLPGRRVAEKWTFRLLQRCWVEFVREPGKAAVA